jgi:hypothetical protein
MPTSDLNPSTDCPSSAVIHRPFGGVYGYRRISDRATRLVVHAFPMSELPKVAAAGLLSTTGAYAMNDGKVAYVGESRRPSRRLSEHAADSAKGFAREVFVVGGCDKLLAVDLQYRLTRCAVDAGVVTVWKGTNPPEPDLTDDERATHDRIAADALRLLHDAGCRIFHPVVEPEAPAQAKAPAQAEVPADEPPDPADCEPMAIGVAAVPVGAAEVELRYGGLWARGYWADDRFIVSPGSEIRQATNDSVEPLIRSRRAELFAAGVLAPIPGLRDRRRLTVAISFRSTSIAAKVLAGAHSAGRWVPRDPSQSPVLLA